MISYKPLFKTLIDKDIAKEELRKQIGAAPSTFTKINAGKPVAIGVIERICLALDCPIQDVIEILPDNVPSKEKGAAVK